MEHNGLGFIELASGQWIRASAINGLFPAAHGWTDVSAVGVPRVMTVNKSAEQIFELIEEVI